jgi:glycosyltransferase involved in cell wall biosynthesis
MRQENRGLAAARNRGLAESSAPYIQFLDADDRLAPSKLATHAGFLDTHPDADIVYGLATYFRTEEPERVLYSLHGHLSRPLMQRVSGNREALEKLEEFNIFVAVAPLIRRRAFDVAGPFNEDVRACEDWDQWLRCARAGCRFEFIDSGAPVAFVRIHPASMSRDSTRMLRGLIDAATKWRGPRLPLVYEMALGVEAVERGRRGEGVRRIRDAALGAHHSLTRYRWTTYALAGLLLPRRLFTWVVTRPMPERGLELLRWLRGRRTA